MGVKEVYRVQKTSKAGNPYEQLVIVFENGYAIRQFMTEEQKYILSDVPVKNE